MTHSNPPPKASVIKSAPPHGRGVMSAVMLCLTLYIFFLYTAQETLLPPVIHSVVMYGFVGLSVLHMVVYQKCMVTAYTWWYVGLIGLSVLSFLWSDVREFGILYQMVVTLVMTWCMTVVIDTLEKLTYVLLVFVCSADIMGLLLLVTGQLDLEAGERLGEAVTGNANSFSALLMVAVVFAFWLFLYHKKKACRLFCLLSFVSLLLLMALSGGRRTILAVLVCVLWFVIAKDWGHGVKTLKNVGVAVALVVVFFGAMMHIPFLYNSVGWRFESFFALMRGGEGRIESDILRQVMIDIGMEGFMESPLVGYGLDSFKYYNQSITGRFYYAHNNYVELLYDLGLVGFVLYYAFILYSSVKLLQLPKIMHPYKVLGIGLILEILVFDIGGVSYYTMMMQLLLCMACMVYGLAKKQATGGVCHE